MEFNTIRIFLVLLVLQPGSRAVKCYQCNSKTDNDCTVSKVDMKYLKPCPSSYPYCRKAVYMYYFMGAREYFTVRECAILRNREKKCYQGHYSRDSYQLICECKGTGCNRTASTFSNSCNLVHVICQLIILLILDPT